MDLPNSVASEPLNLIEVLQQELRHLTPDANDAFYEPLPPGTSDVNAQEAAELGRSASDLKDIFAALYKRGFTALCFSGGGIRSATFGLGVVEALAELRLLDKFDYLSTVSGGGYLGSWLSGWTRREQIYHTNLKAKAAASERETFEKIRHDLYRQARVEGIQEVQARINREQPDDKAGFDPRLEPKEIQFLREYSNYMTPRVGLLSADTWTFVSIYLRNLFLNWTIFLPLLAAVMLLPPVMVNLIALPPGNGVLQLLLVSILVLSAWTLYVIIRCLPSTDSEFAKTKWADGYVVKYGIIPLILLISILCYMIFWHEMNVAGVAWVANDPKMFRFWPFFESYTVVILVAVPALIYLTIKFGVGVWLFHDFLAEPDSGGSSQLSFLQKLIEFFRRLDARRILSTFVSAAVASTIGAYVLSLLLSENTRPLMIALDKDTLLQLHVTFAVPMVLLIFSLATTVFIGFASKVESDGDREWFARLGAWLLIAIAAWVTICALSLWGPSVVASLLAGVVGVFKWLTANAALPTSDLAKTLGAIGGVVSGAITLFGGYTGKSNARHYPTSSLKEKLLAFAPKIAAVVFLAFILAGIAAATNAILATETVKAGLDAAVVKFLGTFDPATSDFLKLGAVMLGLTIVGVLMAWRINVNKFSLHGAYRDRLIRAYLGASKRERDADPFTGFDDRDNFQLHRMRGQRPFHIVNATLNLVDGEKLAWQNRKAAPFIMTPLHCGSWALKGFRCTYEYSRNHELGACQSINYCNRPEICDFAGEGCQIPGKSIRLGTAMAISGAAVNPNMGYYSSPVVMFLMAMFNIRLGWWLGNTNKKGGKKLFRWFGPRYFEMPSPALAVGPLISETFGKTDEERHFINVSDGGHFENLGLYEMVLRRCKFIVVSDAGADGACAFDDLANAVEKCEVDLGVKIDFGLGIKIPPRRFSRSGKRTVESRERLKEPNIRFAVARIRYPENRAGEIAGDGVLLYVKPSFQGDEPIELKHYADANPTFPHQSTADQLFDEKQFEAYRELGYFTMHKILTTINTKHEDVDSMISALREMAGKNNLPSG